MNTSNIKSIATTIAGILGFISLLGATILGVLAQYPMVHVPQIFIIIIGVCGAVSVFVIGYLNGKNPDGSAKTPTQVITANQIAVETKDVPAEEVKV